MEEKYIHSSTAFQFNTCVFQVHDTFLLAVHNFILQQGARLCDVLLLFILLYHSSKPLKSGLVTCCGVFLHFFYFSIVKKNISLNSSIVSFSVSFFFCRGYETIVEQLYRWIHAHRWWCLPCVPCPWFFLTPAYCTSSMEYKSIF